MIYTQSLYIQMVVKATIHNKMPVGFYFLSSQRFIISCQVYPIVAELKYSTSVKTILFKIAVAAKV